MGETYEVPRDHTLADSEPCLEYATEGWWDLVAQVAPPLMDREMITMIVDTLPMFYYEKMVGYIPSSFTNLVFAGERIETCMIHILPHFYDDNHYQVNSFRHHQNLHVSHSPPF
ncbi:hypothetical protein GmHk_20G057451 [Glycine max]|nr:hypothetical protein GmHk_20G057451 [Glycine max]